MVHVSLSLESLLFLNALTHTQSIIMTVYPSLTVNCASICRSCWLTNKLYAEYNSVRSLSRFVLFKLLS